jgi:hypothetical protein
MNNDKIEEIPLTKLTKAQRKTEEFTHAKAHRTEVRERGERCVITKFCVYHRFKRHEKSGIVTENQSILHPRAVIGYETFTPIHQLL